MLDSYCKRSAIPHKTREGNNRWFLQMPGKWEEWYIVRVGEVEKSRSLQYEKPWFPGCKCASSLVQESCYIGLCPHHCLLTVNQSMLNDAHAQGFLHMETQQENCKKFPSKNRLILILSFYSQTSLVQCLLQAIHKIAFCTKLTLGSPPVTQYRYTLHDLLR